MCGGTHICAMKFIPFLKKILLSKGVTFLFPSLVIWMGDLNYRISDLSVDEVVEKVKNSRFGALLKYDQVGVTLALLFFCKWLKKKKHKVRTETAPPISSLDLEVLGKQTI